MNNSTYTINKYLTNPTLPTSPNDSDAAEAKLLEFKETIYRLYKNY